MLSDIDILNLVVRWVHILTAILLVGGTMFWRLVWVPAAMELTDANRAEALNAMLARWNRLVMIGTGLLLISGFINVYRIMLDYELRKPYHMVFGVKVLMAMVIFYVAARLAGRSAAPPGFEKSHASGSASTWSWRSWSSAWAVT